MKVRPKRTEKVGSDAMFLVAILGMLLLIFGISFLVMDSLVQKLVFLAGAAMLLAAVAESRQMVLVAAEITVMVGIVLSLFLSDITIISIIMGIAIVMLIYYLYRIHYFSQENVAVIGTLSFVLLAIGYSVNTGSAPLLNSFAFGFGAILAVIYSSLVFVFKRIRVQLVWVVLNAAFAVTPLIFFFSNI